MTKKNTSMKKMNYLYVAGLFMAATFASCTDERDALLGDNGLNISAEMGTSSRTMLGNDSKTITWCTGDRIYLFDADGTSNGTLSLKSGAGERTATFNGTVTGQISKIDKALYPVPTVSGSEYTFDFPAARTWSANSAAPMIGDFANNHVNFRNLAALVRVDLEGRTYDNQSTLVLTMDGPSITGTATVDMEAESLTIKDGGNTVSITKFGNASFVDFPIPAGTYTHYSLSLNGTKIIDKDIEEDKQIVNKDDVVIISKLDYVVEETTYKVYNVDGLLKWAYMVNNVDPNLNLQLMNDIDMPAFKIAEDPENQTYIFTDEEISTEEGIPSASNWIPITMYKNSNESFENLFKGEVEGNDNKITGLRIIENDMAVGFIGFMERGSSVKNIKFADAIICNENTDWSSDVYGNNSVGVAVGRSQNGTRIENVEVINSKVMGYHNVGGIVGMNYRRAGNQHNEELALVVNCNTDANTKVIAYNTQAGGICGKSYGAAIIGCVNNADVEAHYAAGGIVGCAQEYLSNVNTYVIACGTTSEATINAGGAGGLIGINTKDNSHTYGFNYIVACYSESKIQGDNVGTMIGESRNSTVTASWAVKNGATKYAGFHTLELVASNHYTNASEITPENVEAMNLAIRLYNGTVDEVKCEYEWVYNEGNWPTLVQCGVKEEFGTLVNNVDELKALIADEAYNGEQILLADGIYDLGDGDIYYTTKSMTLKAINKNGAIITGKFVAKHDVTFKNLGFKPSAVSVKDLSKSTYGSYVNGGYAAIVTVNKASAIFEGCSFTELHGEYKACAINYFTEADGKVLKVKNCSFIGSSKAIYSKVLCEITDCNFDLNGGYPLYVWPRATGNGICKFIDNTAVTEAGVQVGLLSQTAPYANVEFNVQNNTGEYNRAFGWVNSARCKTDGSVTFAEGSKKFNIDSEGKMY